MSVSKSFLRPKAKIRLGLWNVGTIYKASRTAQAATWSETVEKELKDMDYTLGKTWKVGHQDLDLIDWSID